VRRIALAALGAFAFTPTAQAAGACGVTATPVRGYPGVPPYPASHGCARIPMSIATTVYGQIACGSAVYVY
jgi:hypothetical protein